MKLGLESRLRRPHTVLDLLRGRSLVAACGKWMPKSMKLLFNMTVQGSVGAVQVLLSQEATVEELITELISGGRCRIEFLHPTEEARARILQHSEQGWI